MAIAEVTYRIPKTDALQESRERYAEASPFVREAVEELRAASEVAEQSAWFEWAWALSRPRGERLTMAASRVVSPGSSVVHSQHARAQSIGVRSTLSADEWGAVWRAFDGRCAYCGARARNLEHVIPVSRGGSNSIENVVPACVPCNASKRAKDVVDWLEEVGLPIAETLDRITEGQVRAMRGA